MLNKKNTSLITLTFLVAIASPFKSVEATSINQANFHLNHEQIAQIPASKNSDRSNQTQSQFPWWLLILVTFVPFLGWFLLSRNNQSKQKSEITDDFSLACDPTSTNHNYGDNFDRIKTENNLNEPNFEDRTILTTTVTSNSNLSEEPPSKNSLTETTNKINLEQPKQISANEPNLSSINQQQSVDVFEASTQPSQLSNASTNNPSDEVQDLSTVPQKFTPVYEQEFTTLFDHQTSSNLDSNLIAEIEQLSQNSDLELNNDLESLNSNNQNNLIDREPELIEDKIGNITDWLEQLDLSSSLSQNDPNSFSETDSLTEANRNLNESNHLNEIDHGLDLESFEQLLFGDLDRNQETKNQN